MITKNLSIKDLQINSKFNREYFVLRDLEKKSSRQDKSYYNFQIADKTGELRGKVWSENMPFVDADLRVGDIVVVSGEVQEYAGKPQIIATEIKKSSDMAPEEFMPVTSRDRSEMLAVLENEIKNIKNPYLKGLLNIFWNDQKWKDLYLNYPAGEYVHHAYVGGLLEHVYEMLELSRPFFRIYPNLNWDLFFCGLLLHDVGKLEEFEVQGATIVRTFDGKMLGHIVQGALIVDRIINKIDGFPSDLKTKLLHLILSHQGSLEFGSPVKPLMLESLILSYVDVNGAEMNQATKHIEKALDPGDNFTEYHKWLGRSLWIGDYYKQSIADS
jgi:3'-5' exoribonuclease